MTQTLAPQTSPDEAPTTPSEREQSGGPSRRQLLGGFLGGLVVAGGGASAWALNRYVVDHVEVSNVSQAEAVTGASAQTVSTGGTVSGLTYASDTATIAISKKVTGSGSDQVTYFVADIRLTDATVLRSAFAQDAFGQNITQDPSTIAKAKNAVWAINGDYYGFRDTGFVIRNGVAYRSEGARQGLALKRDGSMVLYDETATTTEALIADGVWNTLSFGPGIVSGGKVVDGIDDLEVDTNFGKHSIQGNQPRTGIGAVDTNHFIAIVVDGRSAGYSRGVGMSELGQIFADLGAQVAYNLDGGGSSTMVFNDALVNNPLGKGQERGTSDILYIPA